MKHERLLEIIKTCIFLAAGIAILIWNDALRDYIALLVGGVMLLYAVEGIIVRLIAHQAKAHPLSFIDEIILLVLAVLVLLVRHNLDKVCVIWAIWAILGEAEELALVLNKYRRKPILIISIIESVIVIVLSFLLVLTPAEHAHTHIIILGIEMILEVLFPLIDRLSLDAEKAGGQK